MGTSYNSSIVTDGLVLCLDAANPRSYPGSGSSWLDLSGNGNHAPLSNGPTFSSDNAGSIVFDGVDDYIEINDFLPNNNDFTVTFWLNYSSNNASYPYKGIVFTYDTSWNGWGIGTGSGGYVRSWVNDGAGGGKNWILLSAIYDAWHLFTLTYTYSTGTQRFYLDTTYYGQDSFLDTVSPSHLQIARGGQTSSTQLNSYRNLQCKISHFSIYNKALSADEVRRNYNATRGRYGN